MSSTNITSKSASSTEPSYLESDVIQLESCLKKLKKADIVTLSSMYDIKLKRLLNGEFPKKFFKTNLIAKIVEASIKYNYSLPDVIVTISLTSLAIGAKKASWSVYEVLNITNLQAIQNMDEFQSELFKILSKNFTLEIISKSIKQGIWTYLSIKPLSLAYSRNTKVKTIYVVYFPGSQFFFLTGQGLNKYTKYISQALVIMLQGTDVEELSLKGGNIHSLYQLALQRGNRLLNDSKNIPEIIGEKLKKRNPNRKRLFANDLDAEDKHKSKNYLRKTFGEYEQPEIEYLNLKFVTRFYKSQKESDKQLIREPVEFNVKLKGTNVLEGLRSLCEHSILHTPLPAFLEQIPVSGMNDFTIREKL